LIYEMIVGILSHY